MSHDEILATIEASELLKNHIDGHDGEPGRWFELSGVGKDIRVNAWMRLDREARKALTA